MLRDALHDLRLTVRRLRQVRGVTAAAILTFALGIGCSTLVFSIADTLVLRSLPYAQPRGLVVVTERVSPYLEWGLVEELRDATDVFAQLGWHARRPATLSGDGRLAERTLVVAVSRTFLPTVGVRPVIGPGFSTEDFRPGRPGAVLLTHAVWRRRYGAAPEVIGRTLRIDGRPHTIVGVLPPEFKTIDELQGAPEDALSVEVGALVPFPEGSPVLNQEAHWEPAVILGRLRTGVPFARAKRLVETIAPHWVPTEAHMFHSLAPLTEAVAGQIPRQLTILSFAVAVLLLVACGNAVNLMLERFHARRAELAIRAALGASTARLAREVILEAVVLAAAGGVAGLLLAVLGTHGTRTLGARVIPRLQDVAIDVPVLAFAGALSLAVGLLVGAVVAWRLRSIDAVTDLRAEAAAPRRRGRLAVPSVLVVVQVAVSVSLAIAGGLLSREFARLIPYNLGFRTDRTLTAGLTLDPLRYKGQAAAAFFAELLARARALPGAEQVALAEAVPAGRGLLFVTGLRANGQRVAGSMQLVSEDYFALLGMPILAGRAYTGADTAGSEPVLIVNEAFAEKYWGGARAAVGQLVQSQVSTGSKRIVGVVANACDQPAGWPKALPRLYQTFRQQKPWTEMTILVRTRNRDAGALAPTLERLVRELDPDQPLYNVVTLDDLVMAKLAPQRLVLAAVLLFGAITVIVAAIGVHGVLAYAGVLRRREIGVRLALGATSRSIFHLMLGRGATLIGVGAGIGIVAALALVLFVQADVLDLAASDVTLCLLATGVVGAAGLVASVLPALRAVRVSPVESLRNERHLSHR